jgi:hypothetical protein
MVAHRPLCLPSMRGRVADMNVRGRHPSFNGAFASGQAISPPAAWSPRWANLGTPSENQARKYGLETLPELIGAPKVTNARWRPRSCTLHLLDCGLMPSAIGMATSPPPLSTNMDCAIYIMRSSGCTQRSDWSGAWAKLTLVAPRLVSF